VLYVDLDALENYINIEKKELTAINKLQIQILDKGFVTDKEFKKLTKKYKNSETYLSNNEEDFHFKVIN
jgi:hypothetical protein